MSGIIELTAIKCWPADNNFPPERVDIEEGGPKYILNQV